MLCDFLRLDHIKDSFFLGFSFSWITHSKESQLLCCENAEAACEEAPMGEKQRPPTSNQPQLARHVSSHLGSDSLAPVKPSDDSGPG